MKYLPLLLILASALCSAAGASSRPPKSVFGSYAKSHEICDNEGCVRVEDTAEITPSENGVMVSANLAFDFGHTCAIEDKVAEWKGSRLVVKGDENDFVFITFSGKIYSLNSPLIAAHFAALEAAFTKTTRYQGASKNRAANWHGLKVRLRQESSNPSFNARRGTLRLS